MAKRLQVVGTVMSVALLLGLGTGAAAAVERSADIDGGARAVISEPQSTVAPSTDIVSALPEPAATAPESGPADLPEHTGAAKAASVPASVVLTGLDQQQKLNATIGLEPFGAPDAAQLHQASRVENLWSAGRFAEAIQDLENLEAAGGRFAVGIAWKEPVPVDGPKWYPDVQVSSRTNGDTASLDYYADTGSILVLMVMSTTDWAMNISTDGGQSFSESYYWAGATVHADMAVSGDHAWVAYSNSDDLHHNVRMRRFDAVTGAVDSTYGWHTVADETPNTITEVAVAGNTPDNNNRIYAAYIVDETNSIKFWWDDLVGTAFSEIATGISNADSGLDVAWNPFYPSGHARWISYLSTGNYVTLYRSAAGSWEYENSYPFDGISRRTALSAFNDHIYCAFERETDPGKYGVFYLMSDDAGASIWYVDDAYDPTGSAVSGWAPDISIRSGLGRAAVFSSETGDLDDVYVVTNPGWGTGPWSDPAWYNTYDHVSGDETYIEWIGSSCVSTYGMLYFDEDGPKTPYFDLLTPRGFFCDGFEGGTGAWSSTSP